MLRITLPSVFDAYAAKLSINIPKIYTELKNKGSAFNPDFSLTWEFAETV